MIGALASTVAAAVLVIWQLTVEPSRRDEFIALAEDNVAESRSAEGNLQFDVFVDEENPDTVVFIERWASDEARDAYMAWRRERGDTALLEPFFTAPPRLTMYRQAIE